MSFYQKNCILKKIFQNDFLSFGFPILETLFGIPILETCFAYKTPILESHKIVKGNFSILKNVGVKKEKRRDV